MDLIHKGNKNWGIWPVLGICILCFLKCSSFKQNVYYIKDYNDLDLPGIVIDTLTKFTDACDDPLHYLPADDAYIHPRKIRMVFHIINNSDSTANFPENQTTKNYIYYLFNNAIERLQKNAKMNLPVGNNTAVYPAKYSYTKPELPFDLDGNGLFYHYNDDHYFFINKGRNRNNYRRENIDDYVIGGDTILNVFIQVHHPDSLVSLTYSGHDAGVALGKDIKLAGLFENKKAHWYYGTLLNHEVAHVLGLRHAWNAFDKCEDTPVNPNCFSNTGIPPCDGVVSNNLMDYNNTQMAITPCQLGIIHRNFHKEKSLQRKLLVKDWCEITDTSPIIIDKEIYWEGSRDITRSIEVREGGILSMKCRVSMPANSSIKVFPGGTLILNNVRLHNDCQRGWVGIEVLENSDGIGQVKVLGDLKIENTLNHYKNDK